MKPSKPNTPAPPEDDPQPLAVLRLHWKKFFFVSAGVILLIWGVAVVGDFALSHSRRWVTQQAEFTTQRVVLSAQALFAREELVLREQPGGVTVMRAGAGERVAKDESYAMSCKSGRDAEAMRRLQALEQRLAWLREAGQAGQYHAMNAERLGRQVDDTFTEFLVALERGDGARRAAAQEMFLRRATSLEAALGSALDLSGEIASAEAQAEELRAQADAGRFTPIPAPESGVYYPTADGLEEVFTPAALKELTPEGYAELCEAKARPVRDSMGKLVTGFRWYAAVLLEAGPAQQLREGGRYTVSFPQESAREFTMRVESIRGGGGHVAAVLSCEEKDDTLQNLRFAKAEITLETVEGLRVPQSALRFLEKGEGQQRRGYTGVYVARAGRLSVRDVDVLYQDGRTAVLAWGNLREAVAVEGDRITVTGRIQSVTQPAEGRLLILGRDLALTAENLNVKTAVGGNTTAVTAQRRLFNETILKGKDLKWERVGDDLVLTGEGITYQEQRGEGLKIYDTVLVEGRILDSDMPTISEGP